MMKMMKMMGLFLMLWTIFQNVRADLLEDCKEEGRQWGNGEGVDFINPICEKFFLKKASPQSKVFTKDEKRLVYGHENMVFIQDFDDDGSDKKIQYISGEYTRLSEIQALDIDEGYQYLFVLLKSGDIMSYHLDLPGNVAPFRMIHTKELYGAEDIAVDPIQGRIFALNPKSMLLLVYSQKANSMAREGKRNLEILAEEQIPEGLVPKELSFDQKNSIIKILSSDGTVLLQKKI